MSSNSQTLDEFFIPTVPRYKQLGVDELNDTLGDGLFEILTLNRENIKPVEAAKTLSKPSTPKRSSSSVFGSKPPIAAQPPMRFGNSVQRRSVLPDSKPSTPKPKSVFGSKPVVVQPPMRFGNTAQRRSVMPESKPPPTTPKPVSSSSIFDTKPKLVQPPMRFGNSVQRRSLMPESPNRPSSSVSHAVRGIAVSRRSEYVGKK
ncbi:unnamed protein product [Meloidogyne enterolobii]|uniref:Uncharacterized protein n=1 Tax=Meloidogyne enterolobii TaxID=390850 RepID=A0ACB1A1G3_MELEN